MSKKEQKSDEIKVTDEFYIFPDGIQIKIGDVQFQVNQSKMNEFEIEQMEMTVGKKYDMIIAEGLHRRVLEARERERKRSEEFKAKIEADRQRVVARSKKLFEDGMLIVIHEGRVLTPLEPLPSISDDDWIVILDCYGWIHANMGNMHVFKNVIELIFLEKKNPGYRFFLTRDF